MKRRGLIAAGIVLLLIAAFFAYALVYYRADESAQAALESDGNVTVAPIAEGWFFDGPSEDCALAFYPGGKVEAAAYAPLLHALAAGGMDVFLLEVPLRLAVLEPEAAGEVMADYEYDRWYVGGHSLGGAIAANFAAAHGDALEGLILLAAYPTKALPEGLTVISIVGSADGVVNRERLAQGRAFAPDAYVESVIEGGSHAQFGDYGPQRGDGVPTIGAAEQQAETVRIILDTLQKSA